jgi:hypothetical protein
MCRLIRVLRSLLRLSIEGYADMIRFYRRLSENTADRSALVSSPSPACGGGPGWGYLNRHSL